MSRITYSLADLNIIITKHLLPIIQDGTILLLYGQLGAGKTTLVKALVRQLGIQADVSSPTFTYVNTYTSSTGSLTINHFDLYRLRLAEEFVVLGFDEFLTQKNSLIIIEWPEVIKELLLNQKNSTQNIITIQLSHDFKKPETRFLEIQTISSNE